MEIIRSMNTNCLDMNSRIIDRWEPPIEGFVSDPKYAKPISHSINNVNYVLQNIEEFSDSLQSDDVILAHETDEESAKQILDNGFKMKVSNSENIRDNAVFGWLSTKDIGNHVQSVNENADSVILFKAKKQHIYVSSYKSAKKLILDGLDYKTYIRDHTIEYDEFERFVWNGYLNRYGYEPNNLIINHRI